MISESILLARRAKKLSRTALAKTLHVSTQTIYRWERGDTKLPLKQAQKISQALDLNLRIPCPVCAQSLDVSNGAIEAAITGDLRCLLRAAYVVSDDLPIASVEDARRITEISNLLEAALDLVGSSGSPGEE